MSSRLPPLLSGRWSKTLARGVRRGGVGGNDGGLGLRPPARERTSVRWERRTSAKSAAISADFLTLRASWDPAPVLRTENVMKKYLFSIYEMVFWHHCGLTSLAVFFSCSNYERDIFLICTRIYGLDIDI